jgi:hypothetical protein
MNKIILFLVIFFLTAIASQAQEKNQTKVKGKTEYSFLWGAFKSKEYKGKNFDFQFDTPKKEKRSYTKNSFAIDTTKYVQKRLLWGAIQWTEKKETKTK